MATLVKLTICVREGHHGRGERTLQPLTPPLIITLSQTAVDVNGLCTDVGISKALSSQATITSDLIVLFIILRVGLMIQSCRNQAE